MTHEDFVDFGLDLTVAERQSAVWKKVTTYLQWKLDTLREANDRVDLAEVETLRIRTQLQLIKSILSSGEQPGRDSVAVEDSFPDGELAAGNGGAKWSDQ